MSSEQREQLTWWVDLIFKMGTPLIMVVLAYSVMWMRANFASSSDVAIALERIGKVETAILLMAKDNEVNARQDKALFDHETRIRWLEEKNR